MQSVSEAVVAHPSFYRGTKYYLQNSSDLDENCTQIGHIEDKIRAHLYALRIRATELFQDFDPLRSGTMSTAQFRRCIGRCMEKGRNITEKEFNALIQHYGNEKNGLVKYRQFLENIEKIFGDKHLEEKPLLQVVNHYHELRTKNSLMTQEDEIKAKELVDKLRSYVVHHGSDVKSWYRDFDKHNSGFVTYNQFERGFPGNLLSQDEIDLIMTKYADRMNNNINYYKLNVEVNKRVKNNDWKKSPNRQAYKSGKEHVPLGTEAVFHWRANPFHSEVLEAILNKVKKAVFKERKPLFDYFEDYDRHNCGLVTESQFRAVVDMLRLPLDKSEMSTLVEAFKDNAGFVHYRNFGTCIDEVFTSTAVERDPTVDISPPSRDYLVTKSNPISEQDEKILNKVIQRFRNAVKTERILLLPFFKDFDKNCGRVRQITKSHFSRLLSMLKLEIDDNELYVLFKKYEDLNNGFINYLGFIEAVNNQLPESVKPMKLKQEPGYPALPHLTVEQLLHRIRIHVATCRIRVEEFFKDFDTLRLGKIGAGDFQRGLRLIGLSLTRPEYDLLTDHYRDPENPSRCLWRKLESDIISVFGKRQLEKEPKVENVPTTVINHFYDTLDEKPLSPGDEAFLEATLNELRHNILIRQMHTKSFFQDFDKLSTGYVSQTQLRRCLTYLKSNVSDDTFQILVKKWGRKGGLFYYLPLIKALEPELDKDLEDEQIRHIPKGELLGEPIEEDTLMNKLRSKVKTERIRVLDMMKDFDLFHRGRITCNEFKRALKSTSFHLTPREFGILLNKYAWKEDPTFIDYYSFSNDMETVFTKANLERAPTEEPSHFKANLQNAHDVHSQVVHPDLDGIMKKLASHVRMKRMNILPYFQDFDKANSGTVTLNQFFSVLGNHGLHLFTGEDARTLLKEFIVYRHRECIDYLAFHRTLLHYAKEEGRDLFKF